MSEQRWTPGPWQVKFDEDWMDTMIIAPGGAATAKAWDLWEDSEDGKVTQMPTDANAHLIAAAPELYEALRITKVHLEASGFDAKGKVVAQANAALAKARGEVK